MRQGPGDCSDYGLRDAGLEGTGEEKRDKTWVEVDGTGEGLSSEYFLLLFLL